MKTLIIALSVYMTPLFALAGDVREPQSMAIVPAAQAEVVEKLSLVWGISEFDHQYLVNPALLGDPEFRRFVLSISKLPKLDKIDLDHPQ